MSLSLSAPTLKNLWNGIGMLWMLDDSFKYYLDRTRDIRKTDALFIKFKGSSIGNKASIVTISKWLKEAICHFL